MSSPELATLAGHSAPAAAAASHSLHLDEDDEFDRRSTMSNTVYASSCVQVILNAFSEFGFIPLQELFTAMNDVVDPKTGHVTVYSATTVSVTEFRNQLLHGCLEAITESLGYIHDTSSKESNFMIQTESLVKATWSNIMSDFATYISNAKIETNSHAYPMLVAKAVTSLLRVDKIIKILVSAFLIPLFTLNSEASSSAPQPPLTAKEKLLLDQAPEPPNEQLIKYQLLNDLYAIQTKAVENIRASQLYKDDVALATPSDRVSTRGTTSSPPPVSKYQYMMDDELLDLPEFRPLAFPFLAEKQHLDKRLSTQITQQHADYVAAKALREKLKVKSKEIESSRNSNLTKLTAVKVYTTLLSTLGPHITTLVANCQELKGLLDKHTIIPYFGTADTAFQDKDWSSVCWIIYRSFTYPKYSLLFKAYEAWEVGATSDDVLTLRLAPCLQPTNTFRSVLTTHGLVGLHNMDALSCYRIINFWPPDTEHRVLLARRFSDLCNMIELHTEDKVIKWEAIPKEWHLERPPIPEDDSSYYSLQHQPLYQAMLQYISSFDLLKPVMAEQQANASDHGKLITRPPVTSTSSSSSTQPTKTSSKKSFFHRPDPSQKGAYQLSYAPGKVNKLIPYNQKCYIITKNRAGVDVFKAYNAMETPCQSCLDCHNNQKPYICNPTHYVEECSTCKLYGHYTFICHQMVKDGTAVVN